MEANTIALSYAEGVYALADKHQRHDEFVRGFALLDAMLSERLVRSFLESPKIAAELKKTVLRKALSDRARCTQNAHFDLIAIGTHVNLT